MKSLLFLILFPFLPLWLLPESHAQLGLPEEEYKIVYGGLDGSDQKEAVIGRLRNESDVLKTAFLNPSADSLGEGTTLKTYKNRYKVAASQDQRRLALNWTCYALKPGNYNVEVLYAYAEKTRQSATFKITIGDNSFTWNSPTENESSGTFRVDRSNPTFRLSGTVRVSIECLNSRKSGIMIAQVRLVPAGLPKNAIVLSGSQAQCDHVNPDDRYPYIDVARFDEKGGRLTWQIRPGVNKPTCYLLEVEYEAPFYPEGRKMLLSVSNQKKRAWQWIALPTSADYRNRIKTLPVEIVSLDPGLNELSLQLDDECKKNLYSLIIYSSKLIPIKETDRNRLSQTRVRPAVLLRPDKLTAPAVRESTARKISLPELLPVEKGIHQEIFASHKKSLTAKREQLEKNFMAFLLKQRDAFADGKDFASARETQAVIDLYTRGQRNVSSLKAPKTVARAALAFNGKDLQLIEQQKKLYEAELKSFQQKLAAKNDYQGVADIQKHLELMAALTPEGLFSRRVPEPGKPDLCLSGLWLSKDAKGNVSHALLIRQNGSCGRYYPEKTTGSKLLMKKDRSYYWGDFYLKKTGDNRYEFCNPRDNFTVGVFHLVDSQTLSMPYRGNPGLYKRHAEGDPSIQVID